MKTTLPEERTKLVKRAAAASVFTALLLIIAKIAAFIVTGSMAILATTVDSCLDLLASFVNMIAVRQAAVPADKEHRFGHGKFESLAGLAQSAFVFGSGLMLLITALANSESNHKIDNISAGLIVMVFSVVATGFLLALQSYTIKKTSSVAIEADKAHYTGDFAINLSVITSLFLSSFLETGIIDIIFAVVISLYLMYTAYNVFKKSCAMLTDAEISDDDRKKILDICLDADGVLGVYDLRTRSSGSKLFIQCVLEMNGNITLNQSHLICDVVEQNINVIFPNSEVFIHQCPTDIPYVHNSKEQA